jgi:hypothetical protein
MPLLLGAEVLGAQLLVPKDLMEPIVFAIAQHLLLVVAEAAIHH